MSKPVFYYPVTMNQDGNTSSAIAPLIPALPVDSDQPVAILAQDNGATVQGMYVNDGISWRFAVPYVELSAAAIFANAITIYAEPNVPATAPAGSTVYKNGILQAGLAITPGDAIYAALTPQAGGGGGYILPPANATNLGGVIVPASSSLSIDGAGNITIKASVLTNIDSKLSNVVNSGTGTSLVRSVTAGVATLKSVAGADALTVTDDAAGTLTLGVMTASTTQLGVVKVGSGLTIDGQGVLSATASANITLTGDVTGAGSGTVPTVLSTTGVTAGTYTKVTVDTKGRVTAGANLAASDVTTALGFTPYDGTANPNGFLTTNQNIAVSGDVTGNGSTAITLTLANVGTAGTYRSVTVDAKGRVTAGTNPTTLAGYGITDAIPNTGGAVSGNLTFSGGATITGLPTNPVGNTDATSKAYVDGLVAGIASGTSWKTNARAGTTGNIALTGTQTVDGVALVAGDRVLVKDQTDQKENGVYVVAAGAWTRATDLDTGAEIHGMAILVVSGTANDLTQWVNTNSTPPTIGTDNITYTQLQGNGTTYTAGTGLTLSGNEFSISNTGVSAGTYTKVTVNAQGQVTTGANLAASDVNTALGYTAYNGVTNPESFLKANQAITLSGDATGTGTTAISVVLANSGVTAGTYTKVTVDAKGRVTVGDNLSNAEIVAAIGYTPVNKAGDTMDGALNWATTVSIAAAATTDIGAAASNSILVTGNSTITALGTAPSGAERWATFTGTPTLTHNASSLILPTSANIVVAAGDSANFMSLGGGNWRCISYTRADGTPLVGGADATKLPLAGGTMSGAINFAPAVTVASAATTDLGAANSNSVSVTGSTTITSFGTIAAGTMRTVSFVGALTLTHSSALQLPGNANITTAAGDVAEFESLGSGNWRCNYYTKDNGQAVVTSTFTGGTLTSSLDYAPSVNVASAATTDIGAAASNNVTVTGTTTITSFGTIANGAQRTLTFSGILTLTHNATSLILPTGANITTAAGDVAEFVSLGSGNWKCLSYQRADGTALAGAAVPPNATLVNPTITNFTESGVAPPAGAAHTVDLTNGTDVEVTTNANFTLTMPAIAAGKSFTLTVNYGGAHTLSFAGPTIRWANGAAPTATSVNGKADIYVFKANRAGTAWLGNDGGRNF